MVGERRGVGVRDVEDRGAAHGLAGDRRGPVHDAEAGAGRVDLHADDRPAELSAEDEGEVRVDGAGAVVRLGEAFDAETAGVGEVAADEEAVAAYGELGDAAVQAGHDPGLVDLAVLHVDEGDFVAGALDAVGAGDLVEAAGDQCGVGVGSGGDGEHLVVDVEVGADEVFGTPIDDREERLVDDLSVLQLDLAEVAAGDDVVADQIDGIGLRESAVDVLRVEDDRVAALG